ncbi:MAG: cupin domain-containing protein [Anaerolineaceae bacterium]
MKPTPKLINLDMSRKGYLQLLGGPPESVSMRSGEVMLNPGQTVGKHSTHNNEELLVILEGEGAFLLDATTQLEIKVGTVLYCPPETEHDVLNTGATPLRYIYIVSKAE